MNDTAKAPAPAGRAAAKKELPEHLKAYKHVWVFIEQERGQAHPVSWELMGAGRILADKLGVDLAAVVVGARNEATQAVVRESFNYGADLAYLVTDDILTDYRNESYTKAMTDLVNAYKPEILLLGATILGRDLAGSVATTLLTGLTADCTELDVDAEGSLAATRPTFGGSLLCTIFTLNYRPQMATVRPRVMPMPERVEKPIGRVIEHPLGLVEDDIVTKVLSFLPDRDSTKSNFAYRGCGRRRRPRSWLSGKFPADPPARRPRSARNMDVRGRSCKKAGSARTVRSARPAKRSDPSFISRRAFPARSSIAWASRARITSSRSTPTRMRRSSISPMSASSPTRYVFCLRLRKRSRNDCLRISATV